MSATHADVSAKKEGGLCSLDSTSVKRPQETASQLRLKCSGVETDANLHARDCGGVRARGGAGHRGAAGAREVEGWGLQHLMGLELKWCRF